MFETQWKLLVVTPYFVGLRVVVRGPGYRDGNDETLIATEWDSVQNMIIMMIVESE